MNVAIVFGGKSVEHDVSIVTAKQIHSIKQDCTLIYINKEGKLNLYNNSKFEFEDFKGKTPLTEIVLKDGYIFKKTMFGLKKYIKIDCAIICLHGGDGENGKITSMFNMAKIATTAGSHVALGISMDKWLTKVCLKGLKVDNVDGFLINKGDDVLEVDKKISKSFGYPVIIKPNGGGSSIGIQIAKNKQELQNAMLVALEFDNSAIVEQEILDFTEYNCAVYGDVNNYIVSKIDKPVKKDEILSFTDKYLSSNKNKGKGMKGQTRDFPAKLPTKLEEKIREISGLIFTSLGFYGVVRIDFMYDNKLNKLYVNEINSVPGSLATYFFTDDKFTNLNFVNKLVEIGINNHKNLSSVNKNYITKLF